MKVPPGSVPAPLTLNGATGGGQGLHGGLPFGTDIFWRYPMLLPHHAQPHTPTTPTTPLLLDLRSQMPHHLPVDPRAWSRDDVTSFLRWFQEEYDVPKIELEKFFMNGKALSLLTKQDVCQRAPGAGDILHNALQLLLAASATMRFQPPTPASTVPPPNPLSGPGLSPPPTHNGNNNNNHHHHHHHHPYYNVGDRRSPHSAAAAAAAAAAATVVEQQLGSHFLAPPSSVTLSPAPSTDDNSTSGSPKHSGADFHAQQALPMLAAAAAARSHQAALLYATRNVHDHDGSNGMADPGNSGDSNGANSDMEDNDTGSDGHRDHGSPTSSGSSEGNGSGHANHQIHHMPKLHSAFGYSPSSPGLRHNRSLSPGSPDGLDSPNGAQIKEEVVETGSGGRLLWDFLQQLLNEPSQKYSHLIAWKNLDTGVFKIMDPAGLARLWGIQKNHLSMNYDKMSRALRYYYRVNILKKVQGERHCYQFLRNPSELKGIKNISLLRHLPPPSPYAMEDAKTPNGRVPPTASSDDVPHDLSIPKSELRDSPVFTFNVAHTGLVKSEPGSEPGSPAPYSPRSHLPRHRLQAAYDEAPTSPISAMDCSPRVEIKAEKD